MEIFYKHILGNTVKGYPEFLRVYAFVNSHEEIKALEGGWILSNLRKNGKEVWIQTRSDRINLREYFSTRRKKKLLSLKEIEVRRESWGEHSILTLQNILDRYLKYKKFEKYSLERYVNINRDYFIVFSVNKIDHAYLHVRKFACPKSLAVCQFAWTYNNIEIGLGKYAVTYLLSRAKKSGYSYVYFEGGYGNSMIHKTQYPGFEYWTGEMWSTDVAHYRLLCEKEDKIVTLFEARLFEEDLFPDLIPDSEE